MARKHTPVDVQVKRSSAGLGLFANEDIKKGQFIIEYVGEMISNDEADKRGGRYLFEVNSKWTIDGSDRSNTARYINHSCRPNSESDEVKRKIKFYALKNIKKGDEITVDYGEEYVTDYIKPYGCKCAHCQKKK